MPKKTKDNTDKYVWKGYVNINIPSDMIPDAENYIRDQNQVQQHIVTALSEQMTIKLYHDEKSDAYKVVLMDYNPESPNYGHAMSSFGSDWFVALSTALFKHYVLSDRDWNYAGTSTSRSFG